ncbi:hypothetical protein BKA93DRAFT_815063 [Sparassis latifolia]
MGDSNPDAEDHNGSHSPSDAVQPQMTMHPITYSSMPMHMYPFPPGMLPAQPPRTKRRQVKNACTNCQKACKKCDDARPCLRCVKYGIAEECIDSQRKERQKGIKRGPYKKRDGKSVTQAIPMPAAMAAPTPTPPIPYMTPVGYPPGFFGQYSPGPPKPGEAIYYPQFYLAPVPHAPQTLPHPNGQDGEPFPHAPLYSATFLAPYAQPYATPYMIPRPPDGQMMMPPAPPHYAPYPPPQYLSKPPSRSADSGFQMLEVRRDARGENGRMVEAVHGNHGKSG